jgi:hypothetical protein
LRIAPALDHGTSGFMVFGVHWEKGFACQAFGYFTGTIEV